MNRHWVLDLQTGEWMHTGGGESFSSCLKSVLMYTLDCDSDMDMDEIQSMLASSISCQMNYLLTWDTVIVGRIEMTERERTNYVTADEHMESAIRNAQDSFWSAIVDEYPEIETGDLGPGDVCEFDEACEKVLKAWLSNNGGHRYE